MGILVLLLCFLCCCYFPFRCLLRKFNRPAGIPGYLCFLLYCISLAVFIFTLSDAAEYYQQIDVVDSIYTPLAGAHLATPVTFWILSVLSGILLWLKGRRMPPLLFVIALVFSTIGIAGGLAVLVQVSSNTAIQDEEAFLLFPIVHMLLSIAIIFFVVAETAAAAVDRSNNNNRLNLLNRLLAKGFLQPVWVIVLLLPVFIIIVALLTLFGQDPHAFTKVFTDTTTWHFSQQQHPPFLEHQGHYLCTVAARGHARIVRPVRFGHRRGSTILVTRQLLVANAFEQLLEEHCAALHRVVRKLYDRYGFPLSRHIMKPVHSDIVYICMKPAEYFFVIVLYLCCILPEEKIASQYTFGH